MTRTLRERARSGPVVLILDDLHAADAASLVVLWFVVRELSGADILLIGTYRELDAQRQPAVAEALAEIGKEASRILLSGLSRDEVQRHVNESAGREVPIPTVDAVHRITEGNPFFVDEIVRTLIAEGRLDGKIERVAIPESAHVAVHRRLEPLSEACRALLVTAAVIGRDFDVVLLVGVHDAPSNDIEGWLAEAVTGGVIVASGVGRYSFRHALIREAIYDGLSPGRRLLAHRMVGEAIEELYASDLEARSPALAHHFFRAAPGGAAEKAVTYARMAGRRAAALAAHEEAVDQFERALSALGLLPPDDALQSELLIDLGRAYWNAAKQLDSRQAFRRAAEIARRIGDRRLLARAALEISTEFAAGIPDDWQIQMKRDAVDAFEGQDNMYCAQAMADLALSLYWTDEDECRLRLASEAVEMARRLGHAETLAYALVRRSRSTWGPDSVRQRIEDADEILALDVGSRREWLGFMAHAGRGVACLELGDPVGLDRDLAAATRHAERLGQLRLVWWLALFRAMRVSIDGRFDDAERMAGEALTAGERAGDADAVTNFGVQVAAIRYHQNRLAEFEGLVRDVIANAPGLVVWRCVLALIYAQSDRRNDAERELSRICANDLEDIRRDVNWLPSLVFLAEVVWELADAARAARVYELLTPYAGRFVVVAFGSAFMGPVSLALGRAAAAMCENESSERHFRDAIEECARVGAKAFLAHAQYALGRMLNLQEGRGSEAITALDEALDTYRSLGVDARAGAVESLLGPRPDTRRALPVDGRHSEFRLDGASWSVAHAGSLSRLKDGKGPRLIAHLLAHPQQEFHAMDLVSVAEGGRDVVLVRSPVEPDLRVARGSDAGDVLDVTAREAYRRRIEDLRDEIADAESWGDPERGARAKAELDALTSELASAVGLGGRSRKAASEVERARINVTRAIARTIRKLASEQPELGLYFGTTIKTGTYCSYHPDPRIPIDWML